MSALPKKRWTVEEYLAFERGSEEKHELIERDVYLRSGANRNHSLISVNTVSCLDTQLGNQSCELYSGDMRVRVKNDFTYPDIVVVCGTPLFDDDGYVDTLLNPMLIVEVLSPSTELYDRGKKFEKYRTLESFREYVLISQDTYHVERFLRAENGDWIFNEVKGADAEMLLSSVGCTLRLVDLYKRIEFDSDQPPPA